METLSDENETLSQDKRTYSNKMAISSQQLSILQKVCADQEKSLRSLRNELKEVTESSIAERDTLIQGKIALSVKAIFQIRRILFFSCEEKCLPCF